ncbi:MAG: carboxypeptidase-like regulatory domain-containing protein, partial [Flavobacteriaceae bacterium]
MMRTTLITMIAGLMGLTMMAQERTVKGKVKDATGPIQNVNIQVLDKQVSTTTDKEGMYEIPVETGDKLQYSYTGMRTIQIRIEDVTRF